MTDQEIAFLTRLVAANPTETVATLSRVLGDLALECEDLDHRETLRALSLDLRAAVRAQAQ